MDAIRNFDHSIYFDTQLAFLKTIIDTDKYSKIFVFVDRNTAEFCMPLFQTYLDDFTGFDLIETDPGEDNKNIDFCIGIWKTLLDFGADRKCLVINLGGGVITDMGGFVASTYKRGVDFINIPTTLLSMVDASVGGKTGIDIDGVKNMVGTFALPQAVFIEAEFLKSLPEREMLSGFSEMLKHGLICDNNYYQDLKTIDYHNIGIKEIHRSVQIKHEVVSIDPEERGLRKILNFGHTIGHAVESYSLLNDANPLTHGEAIAIGMVCEAYLSHIHNTLTEADLQEIGKCITDIYPTYQIDEDSYERLLELMKSDKKNEHGQVMFSLLSRIGACDYNCNVSETDIIMALNYYNRLNKN